jgi:hypothetical protein
MDFVLLLEDRDGDFHKSYQSMLNLKFPVAFLSNLAVLLSLGALYPDDWFYLKQRWRSFEKDVTQFISSLGICVRNSFGLMVPSTGMTAQMKKTRKI